MEPASGSKRSVWWGWTCSSRRKPVFLPVTSYSRTSPPVSAVVRTNLIRNPSSGTSITSPDFAIRHPSVAVAAPLLGANLLDCPNSAAGRPERINPKRGEGGGGRGGGCRDERYVSHAPACGSRGAPPPPPPRPR